MEEDKRLKLPKNWEAKKARLEWELAENEKKKVFITYSALDVTNKDICMLTLNTDDTRLSSHHIYVR